MSESIIVTSVIGDTYQLLSLDLPLVCLDLLNSQGSMGPDGVIRSFPEEEVT